MNSLIKEKGLEKDVEIVSSIYDSIYIHVHKDPELVKWVNDTIIPLMTKDFLKDIIVHNEAVGEVGLNWFDTVPIANGASVEEIAEAMQKAEEICE